jgi:hypothetical protein
LVIGKEGKVFEGASAAFKSGKSRPRNSTKSKGNSFDESVVPKIVYDFTATE